MSDKIKLMERFHVEVEKELLKERNKTGHLESNVAHLKSEVAMLNQKCLDACRQSNASSGINQNMMLANLSKHFNDLQEGLQRNISYQITSAIDQNRVEMANLTKQFSELKGSFKNMSDQTHLSLQQLQNHGSTPIIAFEAHNLTNCYPSLGEKFVFTAVTLNNGSAYNNTSGMITAPVSGLYQFHVQLCLSDNMYFYVKIKSDSRSLLESSVIDDGSIRYGCNTLSTIGVLGKSEHVWIEFKVVMAGMETYRKLQICRIVFQVS